MRGKHAGRDVAERRRRRAQPSATSTLARRPPTQDYLALVASEAVDQIAVVRFGPAGIRIERTNLTGIMPADVDGPHGVAVSPDGKYYYVSTAHGTPYGFLWKYALANDSLVGRVMLGNFPATLQITPDGAFAYVVNFNLHGEMVPSSVSIVSTDEMVEVARVTTCTMPHGSRINAQGTKQYSACMMDDMAVEIDTRTFGVSRHFVRRQGQGAGDAGRAGARSGEPRVARHERAWNGTAEAGRRQLLADVGAAVGRRRAALRCLQQEQRHRRDRRARRGDWCAASRRATASTTSR